MVALIAACVCSSLIVSLTATAAMRRLAPRWGFVDRPSARKIHAAPVALGGGVGIWLGIVVPISCAQIGAAVLQRLPETPAWFPGDLARHLAGMNARAGQVWLILAAATVISALGLLDDLQNLGWRPKLLVQFALASGLVMGGIRATVFVAAPWVGGALTVLWIVVLTNAFNFLDNMDGLSAGMGLIAAVLFAMIMLTGTSEPRWFVASFLLILAGSLAGFLVHNWPPARIFMGDTGSCLIGLLLACLTVTGTFYDYEQSNRYVMLAPGCVLAVPLYDFCSVVMIRLAQGRSPFHADKWHFSHRLVTLGLSRRYAVLTIYLITLTTGLGGLLLYQVRGWFGAGLVVAFVLALLLVVAILEAAGYRREAGKDPELS